MLASFWDLFFLVLLVSVEEGLVSFCAETAERLGSGYLRGGSCLVVRPFCLLGCYVMQGGVSR
jgi:hypothetical protein